MNFIIAGRDTTSNALSWMTYFLTQYPEIQEKLIQEVDKVTQGHDPSYESVKELDYMHGVIHETLRLRPPVPIEFKTAVEDDNFLQTKYTTD